MAKRKRSGGTVQGIGAALVAFDHQIMRSTPPPHEMVRKGDRLPTVRGAAGGTLEIAFPDEPVAEPSAAGPADSTGTNGFTGHGGDDESRPREGEPTGSAHGELL